MWIKGKKFSFSLGYELYFKIKDKTEYTKILPDTVNHPGIIVKPLYLCRSDENGSSLYNVDYLDALHHEKYLNKHEFKGNSALKIFDIMPE